LVTYGSVRSTRTRIDSGKTARRLPGEKKVLSDSQIEELRRLVEAREPKAALAREFGISLATLYEYLRAPA